MYMISKMASWLSQNIKKFQIKYQENVIQIFGLGFLIELHCSLRGFCYDFRDEKNLVTL